MVKAAPQEISTPKTSHGQILKSTTLVGGSQVIHVLLGIIRTKFLAVLLGPTGIGLIGLYKGLMEIAGALSGMGVRQSGVRQIAEAVGNDDEYKVASTIITLRRTSFALGLIGMFLMTIFCHPLSKVTFGNNKYAWPITLLSVTLFLKAVSDGQVALVQGLRKISDLAKLTIFGAFWGTIISIPMIFFWGKEGIVPFLITVSALTLVTSWWYAHRVPVVKIAIKWSAIFKEAMGLLSLGFVFMTTGLSTAAVLYFIRILVVRKLGMDDLGLYQAATTLSTLYIGFVLNAMAMDFYPRLTANANDNEACNKLVNEQTTVGLLIAMPGIIATLTFAPLVINIFYSASFTMAYEVLRWQIMGIFLRVVSWPLAYVILAKGKGRFFLFTELVANAAHLVLVWVGLNHFGLAGAGIAFFINYVFYTLMLLCIIHHLTKFKWSNFNIRLLGIISLGVAGVFLLSMYAVRDVSLVLGGLITIMATMYSLFLMRRLVGTGWFSGYFKNLKTRLSGRK